MSSTSTVLLAFAEPQHVADRGDQVLGPQRHLRLGHVEAELAVDPEPTDAAEPVAVGIVELLVEQDPGLVEGGGIAGPQPLVDPHQRVLMARRHAGPPLRFVGVLPEAVHDQGHLLLLHHLHRRQPGGADQLGLILR